VVEAIIKKAQEHGLDSGPEGPVAGTLHSFLAPLIEAHGKDMVQASLDHDALVEGIGEVVRSAQQHALRPNDSRLAARREGHWPQLFVPIEPSPHSGATLALTHQLPQSKAPNGAIFLIFRSALPSNC
jgi:hypothetical protein